MGGRDYKDPFEKFKNWIAKYRDRVFEYMYKLYWLKNVVRGSYASEHNASFLEYCLPAYCNNHAFSVPWVFFQTFYFSTSLVFDHFRNAYGRLNETTLSNKLQSVFFSSYFIALWIFYSILVTSIGFSLF